MNTSTQAYLSRLTNNELLQLLSSVQNSSDAESLQMLDALNQMLQLPNGRTPTHDTPEKRREESLCRSSLHEFIRAAWHLIEPDVDYQQNWHIIAWCAHLEAVSRGEIPNLLGNIPPGCMKSLTTCVFWPAWDWIENPGRRFLFASYEQGLSTRDSVKCREIIRSSWYQGYWGTRFGILRDQDEKTRYDNNKGGWRIATSVGGRGIGLHPDVIVVDDANKAKTVESEADRHGVAEWWNGTISMRGVARNVKKVVIMQRLHMDDLAGLICRANGGNPLMIEDPEYWDHVCLPMRAEPEQRMRPTRLGFVDGRRQGELLWPSLFPERTVKLMERTLGSQRAAGQLQQRPVRRGGSRFHRDWFRIEASPMKELLRRAQAAVRYWDFAATEDDGDYTVGTLMLLMDDERICVADVQRGQWSSHNRDRRFKNVAKMDGANVPVRWEEEGGSAGKTVTAHFVRMLRGWDTGGIRPSGKKEVRAEPLISYAEEGLVYLRQASWNADWLDELEAFPAGSHDDQVDSASGAFNFIAAVDDFLSREGDYEASSGQPGEPTELTDELLEGLPDYLRELVEETREDRRTGNGDANRLW